MTGKSDCVKLSLALAQLNIVWENKERNREKCESLVALAASRGSDLILFPEMTLTGFSMNVAKTFDKDQADVRFFCKLAKDYGVFIGFGTTEIKDGKGKNNYLVVSPSDGLISRYSKIHPFSLGEEAKFFEGGEQIESVKINGFSLSPFICYDLRFPEIFQIASDVSHLIVVAANWPQSRRCHWISLLRARAIETQSYVAGINRVGDGNGVSYSGDTIIFDPWGNELGRLEDKEDLLIVALNSEVVLKTREEFALKRDRKECLYMEFFRRRLQGKGL